jgi:hypothetical protein
MPRSATKDEYSAQISKLVFSATARLLLAHLRQQGVALRARPAVNSSNQAVVRSLITQAADLLLAAWEVVIHRALRRLCQLEDVIEPVP